MNINDTFDKLNSSLTGIIGFGFSLAAVFLVVDLLFGAKTNIVANVSALIGSFTSQGIIGLIALIVFAAILSKD